MGATVKSPDQVSPDPESDRAETMASLVEPGAHSRIERTGPSGGTSRQLGEHERSDRRARRARKAIPPTTDPPPTHYCVPVAKQKRHRRVSLLSNRSTELVGRRQECRWARRCDSPVAQRQLARFGRTAALLPGGCPRFCCSAGIATASRSDRLPARRSPANSAPLAQRSVRGGFANVSPLPPWTNLRSGRRAADAQPLPTSALLGLTRRGGRG
jgi:hypothetical protein